MIRVCVEGGPESRGAAQAAGGPDLAAKVRAATVGRVEAARAEGLIDAAALAFVALQRQFHEAQDPDGMAELRGIARGFGLDADELFLHLHLGTIRSLKGGARLDDGCSAWAVAEGAEGPLVVKNRDFTGQHLGIQCVASHSGAGIATGGILCLGSLGSPAAYSSGVNAAGLAIADTQVAVRTHRVGWLRYFLMTRLLARCATVAEALAFLRSVPHCGGGTLILADRGGATAAVELAAQGAAIVTGGTLWRTNHFVTPEAAEETLPPGSDAIAGNSRARFAHLSATLPGRDWTAAEARALMATHADGGAPICQHAEGSQAQTISSAVYSCRDSTMELCEGPPCRGHWWPYGLNR